MIEFLQTLHWGSLFQIVLIDILLGGDNAVVSLFPNASVSFSSQKWQCLLTSSQAKLLGVILTFSLSLTLTINLLANSVDSTFRIFPVTFSAIMWVLIGMVLLRCYCVTNWPSCFPHCPIMIYSDTFNIWTDYGTFDGSLSKTQDPCQGPQVLYDLLPTPLDFSSLNPFFHHMSLQYFTHIIHFLLEGLFLLLSLAGIHIPNIPYGFP